jgi:hypothetical protein
MLFADDGYDHDKYRRLLRQRGIRTAITERGQPHGTGLGTFRWVAERTISWLRSILAGGRRSLCWAGRGGAARHLRPGAQAGRATGLVCASSPTMTA